MAGIGFVGHDTFNFLLYEFYFITSLFANLSRIKCLLQDLLLSYENEISCVLLVPTGLPKTIKL